MIEDTVKIEGDCWVANNAIVLGNVEIQQDCSVWFNSVIRGDMDRIILKRGTNIQDGCVLHTDPHHELCIHEHVTVGHGCVLHGCEIESECLIGMGAVILNGAVIKKHSIIGAGSVVLENTVIPEGSIAVGNPAKVIKKTSIAQIVGIKANALHYSEESKKYKEKGL